MLKNANRHLSQLENGTNRLGCPRVATNVQFVKNAQSAKGNKMRYACNFCLRAQDQLRGSSPLLQQYIVGERLPGDMADASELSPSCAQALVLQDAQGVSVKLTSFQLLS